MTQSVRIYIIGAGVIAYAHAETIQRLPNWETITLSVADPIPQALSRFVEKFPRAQVYNNASEMLAEPARSDDIVIVATPPSTHCELTCMALASGRHVLCEKPLAMNREEGIHMLQAAQTAGKLLGCCSTRLINDDPINEARNIVSEGKLGKLYHLRFIHRQLRARAGIDYQPSSRWFLDKRKSGGGILMDWGGYDFTSINYVLQPTRVEVLSAWMTNPETWTDLPTDVINDVEQHIGAMLRYHLADGNTLIVSYERAACTHGEESSIAELEGSHGAVSWTWPAWRREGAVTHSYDVNGHVERLTKTVLNSNEFHFGEKPLYYFYLHTQGLPSPAPVNEQALFNFSCFRAIYDCIETGQPQNISL